MHLEENINDDPTKITEWLTANNLTLNKSKTEFMLVGSRQRLNTFNRLPSFTIDSNSIKQVEFSKSLGVYIDQNLTWNVHIEHISKKIASCIGILKRSRSFVPFETPLCIYNASVQPHFDYCYSSVAWGITINLFQLNYKNYKIALLVFGPLLHMMPMRMISLLDLAGKNLVFNEN